MPNFDKLQKILGYDFKDLALLKLALTHRSYSRENNERMEFVGDGVLDYAIAISLYNKYPHFDEGTLSKVRSSLVNQETLAEIATNLGLGEYLSLGRGEEKCGGRYRPSILADCLEAIFAAITFDSSHIQAITVIEKLFDEYLENAEHLICKDYKSILQELLQSRKLCLPVYTLRQTDGLAHRMVFYIDCVIADLQLKVTAQGRNKKEASQIAAEKALALICSP